MFPLALHEQACPTSRRGLRRLGSKPSVEYIYTTVDMAAVQLNIYPWIHGTSRLRKDGLRRTNSNRQFQSYGKLTNRRTDDKIRVVLVWQSRVVPGWRKGPPHDKTDWSLDGRGVDVACCMVVCIAGSGRLRAAPLTCALGPDLIQADVWRTGVQGNE